MPIPRRLKRQAGRHALVDGIPFALPVNSEQTPALMAAFPINADRAAALMPGNELHPLRLFGKGLLIITVVDYRVTDIGKYIEYSIAIACTHGRRPAPPILPLVFMKSFGVGQYVFDLPVSTEVSVKGGKGIWGMPKHQASLDFLVGDEWVSSQYDLDGQLAMRVEVRKPDRAWLPMNMGAVNYCQFRGMLMKSYIYFKGKIGFSLFKKGSARLVIGDHPRMAPLKTLEVEPNPVFAGFFPQTQGVLDDHFEAWFLSHDRPPTEAPEGLESVVNLGQGQVWPPAPRRDGPGAVAPDNSYPGPDDRRPSLQA
jgi:hypothetical protein